LALGERSGSGAGAAEGAVASVWEAPRARAAEALAGEVRVLGVGRRATGDRRRLEERLGKAERRAWEASRGVVARSAGEARVPVASRGRVLVAWWRREAARPRPARMEL
jgi:hypothetical protein